MIFQGISLSKMLRLEWGEEERLDGGGCGRVEGEVSYKILLRDEQECNGYGDWCGDGSWDREGGGVSIIEPAFSACRGGASEGESDA